MPSSAIQVLFVANGLDALKSAIGGVQAALDALAKGTKTTTEAAAKVSAGAAAAGVKAHDKAERDKTQATKREERAREQERKAAERAETSFLKAGMSAVSAAERERTEAVKQGSRDRLRIAEEEHRKQQALIQTRARMAGSMVGGAVNRTMGMFGRLAGTAAAIGGGFSLVDSLQSGIQQEKAAGVILRGASNRGDFTNQKEVQQLARATAIGTGGTTDDILGGLDMFVRKTGDLGVAKSLLEQMAKLSAATGTNFENMGDATAEVYNQLKDSKQTMEVMRALAAQGRAGAIDIKDIGEYGARLTAGAAMFTGNLAGNIESFGALSQLAKSRGGAASVAEATESVARLPSDLAKHADEFKAHGVDVYTDKSHTKFRNVEDLIVESVTKSKGDLGVLHDMFGERSFRAAAGAQAIYTNAGGGAAGEAAVRAELASLHAHMTPEDVDRDAKERLAENDAKLNIATERYHAALNDKLLPLMPDLIDKFTRLIPSIEKFLDFLISNPWAGIGGLVGGAIVADIAKAAIGQAASAAVIALIKKLLGGGGGDLPNPTDLPIPKGTGAGAGKLIMRGFSAAAEVAPVLLPLAAAGAGAAYLQSNAEDKGASAAQALLSQGTGGTDAEKRARLDKIMALTDRIETEDKRSAAVQTPEEDVTGADLAARGAAESLVALKREADELRHALSGATDAAGQMASIQPPRTREPSATHAP